MLSTAWASAERTLPYAALHGLLRPELARLGELPAPERAVLDAAFGGGPATPDPAGPAAAALCLLAGAPEPVLLCVDDLDRLDSASRDTLNALARLCGDTHVGMIVAERAAPGTPSAPSDPLTATLEGLPAAEARSLLHRAGRVVGYPEEQLVLAVAGGNPLALTELSLGAGPLGDTAGFGMLPATARLAEAHREDLKGLSVPARSVLLVAALSAAPLARDVLAASTLLLGSTDAARAGLAELTGHGLLTETKSTAREAGTCETAGAAKCGAAEGAVGAGGVVGAAEVVAAAGSAEADGGVESVEADGAGGDGGAAGVAGDGEAGGVAGDMEGVDVFGGAGGAAGPGAGEVAGAAGAAGGVDVFGAVPAGAGAFATEESSLRFPQPLHRSAVLRLEWAARRMAAHAALGQCLTSPPHAAWHTARGPAGVRGPVVRSPGRARSRRDGADRPARDTPAGKPASRVRAVRGR
ncbi:hypothetical protein ACFY6U_06055 [Streptomyces sp. NPDC013157]|uniref:hypothetical protein n=1 Tax=Streptomyces sp. NPDC013157 TaxID=3364861 RepID=UPI0036942B8C